MDARKVIFTLTKPQDFEFDPEETEKEQGQREERLREREGIFHCWHEVEELSPCSGNYIIKKVALVEELLTGIVHEVEHCNLKFIN